MANTKLEWKNRSIYIINMNCSLLHAIRPNFSLVTLRYIKTLTMTKYINTIYLLGYTISYINHNMFLNMQD